MTPGSLGKEQKMLWEVNPCISPRVKNKINAEDVRLPFNKLFQLYGHILTHTYEKSNWIWVNQ